MSERAEHGHWITDEWTTFRAVLVLRVVVLALILFAVGTIGRATGTSDAVLGIVTLAGIDLALSLPYYLLGRSRGSLRQATLGLICVEVVAVTAGEYLVGPRVALYGLPLYGFLIVAAAAVHSPRGAYLVALLSISAHALTVGATLIGLIPVQGDLFLIGEQTTWPWLTVLLNTTNCTAFAAISGALSGALRAALVRSRGFESDLRLLNDDLEQKVRVAVSDLHVANRALNLRNRELGRTAAQAELFSRAVAHDLRNPLTAASEALRLLEGRREREREGLIALARQNLIRADRMLIGLRDLIRTTGAGSAPGPVSVDTVVAEVIAELRAAGRLEGVEIEVRALPELLGRQEQLAHIFRNLMSNAVDHSGRRRHSIEVGHELRGGEDHYYVRDRGVGVPFELRERIFEPFRRGPAAAPDGLGLGLALVRSIVSQAGGRVWVEDTPGGGATFVFLLGSEGEPAGL